jgi:hypothetical protein
MGTSQYPRIGYRLAPKCLHEILDIPALDSRSAQGRRVKLKYSELDEASWTRFNTRICRKLGQKIVRQTSLQIGSFPKKILTRRLPMIPPGVELDDLDLEPRTRNRLKQMMWNAGVARLDGLKQLTIERILNTSGFGARCLVDLLTSLEGVAIGNDQINIVDTEDKKHELDEPTVHLDGCLTQEATRLRQVPNAKSVRLDDPRLARYFREIFRYASAMGNGTPLNTQATVADMADRIANRRCDPLNSMALSEQIRALRKHIAAASRVPLEKELRGITVSIKGQRAAKIFLRYRGWDDKGPCTLDAAGAEFGISGSAVRQICAYFKERFGTKRPYLPSLERTLAFVRTLLPAPACEIELALSQQRLTEKNFRLEGILCAASFFHRPALFRIETVNGVRMAMPERGTAITREIIRVARRTIIHSGIATLGNVTEQIGKKTSFAVSPEFVSKVLQSRRDFEWLDRKNNWFWLSSVRHNPLVNLIRRILSVSQRIDAKEILVAVSRSIRSCEPALPKHVLLELCRRLPMCLVLGNRVSASQSIEPLATMGNSEFLMFRILKDDGPLLEWRTYQALCAAAGVNENTFNKAIRESPIIVRQAVGIYRMIGAHVPASLDRSDSLHSHERRRPVPADLVVCEALSLRDGTAGTTRRILGNPAP